MLAPVAVSEELKQTDRQNYTFVLDYETKASNLDSFNKHFEFTKHPIFNFCLVFAKQPHIESN